MIFKEKIIFDKHDCEKIIQQVEVDCTAWNYYDRKYESQSLNYSDNTKWIFDRLKVFFEEETNIEIYNIKKNIHFHKYVKDDWFGIHNDEKYSRLYAVGVLLNDNFFGGDFKLHQDKEVYISKKIGNGYIFDVRISHEITKIIEGERYSLLWFLENNNLKFHKKSLL